MSYYSKNIITYSGGATIFSIPFEYNDPTEIHVFVNNVETTNFTIDDGSVNLSAPLQGGDIITIQRITDITESYVEFNGASGLTTDDLNRANSQLLHVVQESVDFVKSQLITDITDTYWQGKGKKISNLADGVANTDAATVGQLKPYADSAIIARDAAIIAKDAAESARDLTEGYASTAGMLETIATVTSLVNTVSESEANASNSELNSYNSSLASALSAGASAASATNAASSANTASLAAQSIASVAKATKASLDADLAYNVNTLALVTNDSTSTNNGLYIKLGASGSGSWQKSAYVPPVVDGTVTTPKLANQSVTEQKMSFYSESRNLFNKYTLNLGYYADWITGNLISSAGYNASDYIPVLASTYYYFNAKVRSVVYYNSSKVFISADQPAAATRLFIAPSGTAYIRISLYVSDNVTETFRIERGDSIFADKYVPHYVLDGSYLGEESVAKEKIKNGAINEDKTTFFTQSTKNLINTLRLVPTAYIDPTTGVLKYDPINYTFFATEYIPVTANITYVCNKKIRSISYYDAAKAFISGVSIEKVAGASFTTPSGTAFLRLNLYPVDVSGIQLEVGTAITTYEPYKLFNGFIPDGSITGAKLANGVVASVWKGKSFVTLGDSITWQDGNVYSDSGLVANGYQTILKNTLQFSSYLNAGVSGRPMANGTANGDGTNTTGKTVTYTGYDLVIIAAGTNDFKLNVPLGSLGVIGDTSFDTNQFYGAYRDLIEYILTAKPTTRICLWTPLQRDNSGYDLNYTNSAGHKLIDYVNAIKNIGQMYGIPVCDQFSNSGITKKTMSTYLKDGLHPNDVGYARMGAYGAGFINTIGC